MKWPPRAFFLLFAITNSCYALAQESPTSTTTSAVSRLSDKTLDILNNRYTLVDKLIERRTKKMLVKMKKKELALQKKLRGQVHGADSLRVAALFTGAPNRYDQMLSELPSQTAVHPLKEYLPGVDSMQTALRFLNQPGSNLGQVELQKIAGLSTQLQQVEGHLQQANDIQAYVRQREQLLKDQLSQYDIGKQLLGVNSEVYYYQSYLTQYKNILSDPEKSEQIILSAIRQLPAFQRFWQQNSYFSQLFPASPYEGTPLALAGLQTRDQLQQQLQQKFGVSAPPNLDGGGEGGGGGGYLQQQMQNAQTQLDAIKNKLAGSGAGSSNMTMPDFQPNGQHVKSFLQRLEFGFNIQNNSSTALLPAISTLGLNIGYKISDKAVVGIGGSYLLGLGRGLNQIALSNQGIGWRTYMDVRAKGSIWITGGWESNYMQQFNHLQNLPNINAWQQSALVGLTKKFKVGRKTGNLQLLYDLLADSELPRGQALKFRIGWGL